MLWVVVVVDVGRVASAVEFERSAGSRLLCMFVAATEIWLESSR